MDDGLGCFRGVLNGMLFSAPLWVGLLVWWLR